MKVGDQDHRESNSEDRGNSGARAARRAIHRALDEAARADLSGLALPRSVNAWTLDQDDLKFLVSLVRRLGPRHVLEFGSGLSTRVLAATCAGAGLSCRITSVDHDPELSRSAAQELARANLSDSVRFVVAPLVARDCGGKTLPVYLFDTKEVAGSTPADLVLVDGPPELLGGREGALYQALARARAGTVIVLDDADRASEQVALSHVQDNLGGAIAVQILPAPYRGLVAIIVHQPVPLTQLSEHRRRLSVREVARLIPTHHPFILADQAQWGAGFVPGRRTIPFTERDGQYWGPPGNDAAAIAELGRLLQAGASHLVVVWPAFWWLDYYREFHKYLQANYRLLLKNDRLQIFDLTGRKPITRAKGGNI